MTVGCLGEGEKTILDLFSVFLEKNKFSGEDFFEINGLVYKRENELIINPSQKWIWNMDEIPLPARDLFKIGRHSYMFTSRGCPYHCIFCASTIFWNRVRFFSADYVVNEIEELVNRYKVKLISFFDDLFIADKERLEKIIKLLKQRKLQGKVKFTCSGRANLITEEVAKLLKEMRVLSVGMGLESGSDKILKYLKGGNVSVADNKKSIAILKKYGIAANASFIIGSPQETKEDILKTYNFIKDNPLSLFDTYVLTPYPGTGVWQYAQERKLVSDNMDWDELNINFGRYSSKTIILSEVLSRREIVALYRKFQRLRLWKNAKNVWFTPQLFDLPKMIFKMIQEQIFLLRRIFSYDKK